MGGFGSGRWGWHRKKTRAEHCRWFTVAEVGGRHPPAAGRSGTLKWPADAGVESALAFAFPHARTPTLAYGWGTGADRKEFAYPLALFTLSTPHGGTRDLAGRPLTLNGVRCHRRVAKLFQPPGSPYFGCRHCHRLTYRSQQAHDPRVSALLRGGPDRLFELADDPARLPVPMLGRVLFALDEWRHRNAKAMKRLDPKPPPRRRKPKVTTATTQNTTNTTPPADAPLRPLLVDINRLAVLFDRSVASLERDQAAGRLPAPVRIGGSKKWRLTDIQAWVAAGCPTRKAK